MTWMSYSTKALTLFGVLPLVLKKFSSGDVVLWYLFSTIISLQSIADFGFRQTFSRIITYAFGGAQDIAVFKDSGQEGSNSSANKPNEPLMHDIISCMKHIYVWLTLILFVLMVSLGSWSMMKPIAGTANKNEAWWAWCIVLLVSCVSFYGKIYLNFLEGLYKIALVRRIETLTSTGSILTSIAVLYFAPSLINLVIVNQFWVLVVTVRDWYLCRHVNDSLYLRVSKMLPFNKVIFQKIWQPAWRSGISGFMSVGLTNLTGVVYAQIGNTGEVASYLLAIRIINQVKEVSMAPFYSKIPLMSLLRVRGDIKALVRVVQKGMFLSHLVFVIVCVSVGIFSPYLLRLFHSQTAFVSSQMWLLLSIAFFIHRYGAMHIQVYMTTNHIISHIADGVSGVLYILSSLILSKYTGIYAVPLSMIVGYLGFYAWYAARFSYKSLGETFWSFEKRAMLIPVCIIVFYIIISML